MRGLNRMEVSYPLNKVKLRVGLTGLHYHLKDCPVASGLSFPESKYNDYLNIEVPEEYIKEGSSLVFLNKTYISHIKMCKLLIENKSKKKSK